MGVIALRHAHAARGESMAPYIHSTPLFRHRTVEASSCWISISVSMAVLRLALAAGLRLQRSAVAASLLLRTAARWRGITPRLAASAESPLVPRAVAGEVAVTPLLIVDDGLRRTFIHNMPGPPVARAGIAQERADQPVATGRRAAGRRRAASAGRRASRRSTNLAAASMKCRAPRATCRSCRASRKSRRSTPRSKV